jgi:hypothetical protein
VLRSLNFPVVGRVPGSVPRQDGLKGCSQLHEERGSRKMSRKVFLHFKKQISRPSSRWIEAYYSIQYASTLEYDG